MTQALELTILRGMDESQVRATRQQLGAFVVGATVLAAVGLAVPTGFAERISAASIAAVLPIPLGVGCFVALSGRVWVVRFGTAAIRVGLGCFLILATLDLATLGNGSPDARFVGWSLGVSALLVAGLVRPPWNARQPIDG